MKRVTALFLALTLLLCGVALGEQSGGEMEICMGNELGLGLLRELYAEGENALVSPASLVLCLALAARGAEGDTLKELSGLAGADLTDASAAKALSDALKAAGARIANAGFVSPEAALREAYTADLSEQLGAAWFTLDDSAVETVNAWAEEATDGLIQGFLKEAPDPDTRLLLMNAVAMEAKWSNPFLACNTEARPFHGADGDRDVPTMNREAALPYGEDELGQRVRLDYLDSGLAMYVMLPAQGKMDEALACLEETGGACLWDGMETQKVNLFLPKIDLSVNGEIAQPLKEMGLRLSTDAEQADFSRMSDESLAIGEIRQAARLLVDEDGTKAAAVTEMGISATALMPEMEEKTAVMDVNRPYVLAVTERETGAILFAAIVSDPKN